VIPNRLCFPVVTCISLKLITWSGTDLLGLYHKRLNAGCVSISSHTIVNLGRR
jgi:hypothetical protein